MRSRSVRLSLGVPVAVAAAVLLAATSAGADGASLGDPRDPGPLDIARIAQRHRTDDEVTYRVRFRERFAKRVLVHRFELYLEGRRGTTSPFESPSTLVYGRTVRDDDRIFMRLSYFDVEMVTHRLADVALRKRPRAVVVTIPTSLLSTTMPFTYRWVARTEFDPIGAPRIEDQTDWLWHRIRP